MYTRLITRIETTCYRLGKDDKFQLFICLSAHDRLLGRIITDLTKAVAAQQVGIYKLVFVPVCYNRFINLSIDLQLFEDYAFFRDPSLISSLSHVLRALDDISVPVDPALKATLERHNFDN